MNETRSGYIVLAPGEGVSPSAVEVTAALEAAGWRRWSGTGWPALVVFHVGGPKGDYFEAGVWAGAGVPVFFLGGGSRCHGRKQIVGRLGGWTVVGANNRADVPALMEAIARRGLAPIGAAEDAP